jgi:hypothetical protein
MSHAGVADVYAGENKSPVGSKFFSSMQRLIAGPQIFFLAQVPRDPSK